MKKLLLSLIASCGLLNASAQLDDGLKAQDFTFTALNNSSQVVNLYSWLDSGKYVFLDVSATWCGPCWSYHNTHALKDLYLQHGPGTTSNDVRVVFVEGDGTTDDSKMSGGSGSQGNWLSGTPYPMCNPASALANTFNDNYEINYFPTVYMICPDRTVKEVGTLTAAQLYALVSPTAQCAPKINVDVTPWAYNGEYYSCDGQLDVKVDFKNRGFNNLNNATINIKQGTTTISTQNWTGNLSTYQTASVNFGKLAVNPSIDSIIIEVITNGDQLANNNVGRIKGIKSYPTSTPTNQLNMEIKTDGYSASETSWILKDDAGATIDQGPIGSLANNTTVNKQWTLPSNKCYILSVTDGYGDGLNDNNAGGYVKVTDGAGSVLLQKTGTWFRTGSAFKQGPVGINEISSDLNMEIYPNPFNDNFNIQTNLVNTSATVTLNDISGKVVYTETLNTKDGLITINPESLPNGVYFIKVSTENKVFNQKIIKN